MFRKLKGEAVGLADLAVVRPALAKGLQALLQFDGDVAEVFCRTFVGDYEAWGEVQEVPLLPGGADITVTNSNRAGEADPSFYRRAEGLTASLQILCGGTDRKST